MNLLNHLAASLASAVAAELLTAATRPSPTPPNRRPR